MTTTRVALVTGGASGIGAAVAERFAQEKRDVALVDLDEAKAAAYAKTLADKYAARVVGLGADVREKGAAARILEQVIPIFDRVDILVNAVGGSSPYRSVEDITDEDWYGQLALNLYGTFQLTRAVVPGMKTRKWGRIVNFSSVAGRTRSLFGSAAYTTAKAGVIGFTRQCAYELGTFGITVNVVAPGVTLSERVEQRWMAKPEAERDLILQLTPVRRAGMPSEVAPAVSFLCGEDAGFITGATIDANGGLHIG